MTTYLVSTMAARAYMAKIGPPPEAHGGGDAADAWDATAETLASHGTRGAACSICGETVDDGVRVSTFVLYTPSDEPVVIYPDAPLPGGLTLPATFDAICVGCRAAKVTP